VAHMGPGFRRESVPVAVSCTAGRQRRWGTNNKQDGTEIRYGKKPFPAKAGAHPSSAQQADRWIPAFRRESALVSVSSRACPWLEQGWVGRPVPNSR
jgi:hypothetical protein